MLSSIVVAVEPAGELTRPLRRAAVEAPVGPLTEHRLNEALRLAIGAGPIGAGAQVADAQLATGDGMDHRAVGGAVVGHYSLDLHAALCEPSHRPSQKRSGGLATFVRQDLDIGEPGGVVDTDMAALPAVAAAGIPVPGRPFSRCLEAAEFLDVDVDQLARAPALIAVRWLGRLEAAALAEPDPLQPKGNRGERQAERLGYLGRCHPQPPQGADRLHGRGRCAVRNAPWRRRSIEQSGLPLRAPAAKPLAS